MLKIYQSERKFFSFNVNVGKGSKRITMQPLGDGSGSYFATDDESVQKAIEDRVDFGDGKAIFLNPDEYKSEEPAIDKEEGIQPEPQEPKDSKMESVTDIQMAREYLISIGYDTKKLTAKNLVATIQTCGISFPNLVIE